MQNEQEIPQSPYISNAAPETVYASKRIEYDAAGHIIYMGNAIAVAQETDAKWRIEKLEYGQHGFVRNRFPKMENGEANSYYNFKWSERANYEYA